jgi:hypothetical protein
MTEPVRDTGTAMATAPSSWIGTLRERPLHASLKRWYARPGDLTEVAVDGFVIDLVRRDLLIEVQTRGFSSVRHKVAALLDRGHHVRIVHPSLSIRGSSSSTATAACSVADGHRDMAARATPSPSW